MIDRERVTCNWITLSNVFTYYFHVLKINLSLSYYLPEDFHILWPKRLRAESTHPENWPKRPTYQGRNDPPPKLAETTQAETTQAETTQGRNDPDSVYQMPKVSIINTVFKLSNIQIVWIVKGWSF